MYNFWELRWNVALRTNMYRLELWCMVLCHKSTIGNNFHHWVCRYNLNQWDFYNASVSVNDIVRHHCLSVRDAANINTRLAKLSNIETWAQANNMTLNRSKSGEIFLGAIKDGSRLINRHHYQTLPASHPLRSWVWRSPTVSQSVSMFRMSSFRVHRPCMVCELCAITAWWAQHCRLFSSRLLLPSLFMLPVHGMAFTWQLTVIILKQSSAEEYVLRSGLCSTDQLLLRELIDDAEDSLLSQLMNNENHLIIYIFISQ